MALISAKSEGHINIQSDSAVNNIKIIICLFVCLCVCFVALRPKSTALVIAGRSVHLTTLFTGQA